MANDEKTLWIDMTDLRMWQGNLTGIQRTVFNLGKRFEESDMPVRFFYFEATTSQFFECEFGIQKSIQNQQEPTVQPSQSAAKVYAKSIARRLPDPARRQLRRIRDARARKSIATGAVSSPDKSPFARGDSVLVLGGNWGDNTRYFIQELAEQKKKKQLSLAHVVYDLLPVRYPNFFLPGSTDSYHRYLEALVECADWLPCISNATKKDLDAFIDTTRPSHRPITGVFHLGEDTNGGSKPVYTDKLKYLVGDGEFLLSVGTLEGRKNHHLLYLAYKEALRSGVALPPLFIAGRRGWMTGDAQHLIDADPDMKGLVTILDDVDDAELAWLYTNCLFCIYPSMYEGWGLPVSEAASYGKLCLTSQNSSLPEVMGELVDYFSPFDSGACLEKIQMYVSNRKLLKEKERKIKERTMWTWDDSFGQFVDLMGKVDRLK